jgi:hypothetical protein
MESLKKQKKRYFSSACDGGLQHAEQYFGLRDIKDFDPFSDVFFVSLDLEVSRQERSKPGALLVREFGIATLDTRYLRSLASPFVATKIISTFQFSTSTPLKSSFVAISRTSKNARSQKRILCDRGIFPPLLPNPYVYKTAALPIHAPYEI